MEMKEKIRCPQCNGTQVYLRLKNSEFVCRGCGQTWDYLKVDKNPFKSVENKEIRK